MAIDKLKTKFITGAFINDVKHYFTKINEIIDYLNGIINYTPPYTEYAVILEQVGIAAPTKTLQIDSLNIDSEVVLSRVNTGIYRIQTTNPVFTDLKTTFIITNNYISAPVFIAPSKVSENRINFYVRDLAGVLSDDLILSCTIIIRVKI